MYFFTKGSTNVLEKKLQIILFDQRGKKALGKRQIPPQKLEVGLRIGLYLLVEMEKRNTNNKRL